MPLTSRPAVRDIFDQVGPTLTQQVAQLFANGEQGAWLDPSSLGSMFQDAAGTIPVTLPGQGVADSPVGRINDLSGRGNHAVQVTSSLRPTLSARVNLLTGTDALSTQIVTTLAGQYRLQFSGSGSVTLSGSFSSGPLVGGGPTNFTPIAGALTLTVSGSVTFADLRPVDQIGIGNPYQRVTTASNYDVAGFPMYLKFDGVDDFMVTSGIDFGASDKASMVAGFRKQIDLTAGLLAEISASALANNGAFGMLAPNSALATDVNWVVRGNPTSAQTLRTGYAAPLSMVFTGLADLASGISSRVNGANEQTTAGILNGGFGNYPLFIGRRNGSTLPFNGNMYGLVTRSGPLTLLQTQSIESYMNQQMGGIY